VEPRYTLIVFRIGTVPLWEKTQPDLSLYCLACDNLFAKQSVFDGHLGGKKHLKGLETLKKQGIKETEALKLEKASDYVELKYQKSKPTAYLEFLISKYVSILKEVREETRGHVERKQALTDKERV
jgi:splicing factor 3A subunit 3